MTIFYALRGMRYLLWSGIAYIMMSILIFLVGDLSSFDWIWFVLGIIHLLLYFYQKHKGYLTIKDGLIKKHDFTFEKMQVSDIKTVKYFAGDYVLKSQKKKMTINNQRYEKAIEQNLAELNNAILKRRALIGIHSIDSAHGLDFFRVATHALYNDIITHTVKVFEDNLNAASFWYIVRTNEAAINKIIKPKNIS